MVEVISALELGVTSDVTVGVIGFELEFPELEPVSSDSASS